jgi:hypothetical protein
MWWLSKRMWWLNEDVVAQRGCGGSVRMWWFSEDLVAQLTKAIG